MIKQEKQINEKLLFLGAGSISEALIKGFITSGQVPAEMITVSNHENRERLEYLREHYGVQISSDKKALPISQSQILILAMKPYHVATALHTLAPYITTDHLVVSLVAGVNTTTIEQLLGLPVPIVRAMPNTASQVRASATALARGSRASTHHVATIYKLFCSLGSTVLVEEALMNAVTGLSGSGPAYFYYILEALMQAGEDSGLSRETSRELLLQTVDGVIKMLRETGAEPAALRQRVTSPGGTTMAAITTLEQAQVSQHLMQAMRNAVHRADELEAAFSEAATQAR